VFATSKVPSSVLLKICVTEANELLRHCQYYVLLHLDYTALG
jgi:hypothetical protein